MRNQMSAQLVKDNGTRMIHAGYARMLVRQGKATVVLKFPYRIKLCT